MWKKHKPLPLKNSKASTADRKPSALVSQQFLLFDAVGTENQLVGIQKSRTTDHCLLNRQLFRRGARQQKESRGTENACYVYKPQPSAPNLESALSNENLSRLFHEGLKLVRIRCWKFTSHNSTRRQVATNLSQSRSPIHWACTLWRAIPSRRTTQSCTCSRCAHSVIHAPHLCKV